MMEGVKGLGIFSLVFFFLSLVFFFWFFVVTIFCSLVAVYFYKEH